MPRRAQFASYPKKKHKTGQARIRVDGVDVYLGPHGSDASWAEYHRLLADWRRRQASGEAARCGPVRTVTDLAARFWSHAERHYAG